MKKKPFKETQVGKFLTSKGFDFVLDAVGSVVPGVAMLDQVKDMVLGPGSKRVMTPEDREEFLRLMEIEHKTLDSLLADTANARNRQIEMAKSGKSDIMHYVVTSFFLLCFGAIIFQKLFFPTKITGFEGFEEVIKNIVLIIAGFYYGSSQGSRMKDLQRIKKDE
ncbi:MAG TPA: hypothetical protein PKD91_09105 [Bacteroidia bacterium]|nr:hypothetical protein [Bacteroidia bacterium]